MYISLPFIYEWLYFQIPILGDHNSSMLNIQENYIYPPTKSFQRFVASGKIKQKVLTTAILWNEAVRGRHKEDIISTFYTFFCWVRDYELDNCAALNKNLCLFYFFIYLINSNGIALKFLKLKHFEPSYTYMAADYFHHLVETSLKKR